MIFWFPLSKRENNDRNNVTSPRVTWRVGHKSLANIFGIFVKWPAEEADNIFWKSNACFGEMRNSSDNSNKEAEKRVLLSTLLFSRDFFLFLCQQVTNFITRYLHFQNNSPFFRWSCQLFLFVKLNIQDGAR